MKQLLVVMMSFLLSTPLMAKCPKNINYGDIPFEKNSSYFSGKYTQKLKKLVTETQQGDGYLLLEFPVYKGQTDKKLREYDMWLANRRIDRVKHYLTQSAFSQPIVTRILTASDNDTRSVSLHWCTQTVPQTIMASTADKQSNIDSMTSPK